MDYSNRKFAFYIEAKKPKCTTQLMFSDNPDYENAGKEVLEQFDKYFPEAVDRRIYRAMEYSAYLKEVNAADEFNRYMNN